MTEATWSERLRPSNAEAIHRINVRDQRGGFSYYLVKPFPGYSESLRKAVDADEGFRVDDFGELLAFGSGEPDRDTLDSIRATTGAAV